MDSPQRREITKRTLALCKQRENETISDFIKRLTPLVEVANPSLNDSQRKEKICEEFLDRVRPNIGFLIRLVGLSKTKDLDVVKAQAEELETLLVTGQGGLPESLKQAVSVLNSRAQPGVSESNYTHLDEISDQFNSCNSSNSFPTPNNNNYYQQDYGNYQQHNERRWNNQMICDYCGRRGHSANICYKRQSQYQQGSSQFDNQRDPRQQIDPLEYTGTKVDLSEVIRALVGIKLQEGNEQGSSTTKRGSLDHVDSLVTVSPKLESKPKINQSVSCPLKISIWEDAEEIKRICAIDGIFPHISIVTAFFNDNYPLQCLIDTGATLTMAPISVANKIKCRLHPTETEAVSSSGHSILFLQQGEAVLKIAEQVVPVLINFVDDAQFNLASGYQIVLGCDVLKRLPKVSFNFNENKLYVGENWVELCPNLR
jgi:predicted aspartyl protease